MVDVARDGSEPSGLPADPAAGAPPEPPSGGAAGVLRLVAAVGSPIAIGTGLLFYFGWVRASVQARRLGYDTAILDWSIQDYMLRSISVLFIPLMALLVVALLLVWLHHSLLLPAVGRHERLTTQAPRWLKRSWLLWVSAGIALSLVAGPFSGLAISTSITLGLLCALYGDLLARRPGGREPSGQAQMSTAAKALVLALLALSVFWNTERLAGIIGEAYADQIAADPRRLLAVTVYSPQSLEVDVPGVVETKLGGGDSAYRYRYQGLRLVQRSGNRYLLISELWDEQSGRIVVLRDTDAIRMEFAR